MTLYTLRKPLHATAEGRLTALRAGLIVEPQGEPDAAGRVRLLIFEKMPAGGLAAVFGGFPVHVLAGHLESAREREQTV